MTAPRLADLFCGEGGCAAGYAKAGWEVHGADSNGRLRARYLRSGAASFTEADATTFPLDGFDAVHASPPCEDHSATMGFGLADRGTGWLLPHTIARLRAWGATGRPWVVENVESAATRRLMPGAVMLCGSMFGLGAEDSRGQYRVLKRHRLFLANFPIVPPVPCTCRGQLVGGVYGHGEQGVNGGRGYGFNAEGARKALGMPWASRDGCAEGIPPAFTRHIGEALLAHVLAGVR